MIAARCRIAALSGLVLVESLCVPIAARAAADPALLCEKTAGIALASCVKKLAKLQGKCYADGGAACAGDDADIATALGALAKRVGAKCGSDAVVQSAGYGAMTAAGLTARLQASCRTEAAALASRTFGGPQGAVLATASDADRACLTTLMAESGKLLSRALKTQSVCIDRQRKKGNCDLAKTEEKLATLSAGAVEKITAACGDPDPLAGLITIDRGEYLNRTAAQARCMTAMAHPDTAPLTLDCGPRAGLAATPRGQYVQVVLDEAAWGSRCGDGSPYAFWVRLAPPGYPVGNVVLQMQGGGVCIFESDCASRGADLFEALSDTPETSGIMSNDPMVSPFANWTKVYLPYCTQDVFIGGGAVSNFPSITVNRFGAVNTRAALRFVRDALWRELDASTATGYNPDDVRMLFGGTSAGGFGTLYNYHYVLDDLQWAHTAAWPDAALALDNGQSLGIAALGALLTSTTPPFGWASKPYMPPYCFATNCGVGPVLYAASAPRLKAVPEQQFLVLSNQVDNTQVSTTFFPNLVSFINTARQAYCSTAGTNGLRYFLTAIPSSTHVISTRQTLFTGYAVDGVLMRDWLAQAMTSPDTLADAVEEGTLTTSIPGVLPFPCMVD
jgi:hypothetical protein